MKKCKDCRYNKKEGKEFRCEAEGHFVTHCQNNCDGCEDFKPKHIIHIPTPSGRNNIYEIYEEYKKGEK